MQLGCMGSVLQALNGAPTHPPWHPSFAPPSACRDRAGPTRKRRRRHPGQSRQRGCEHAGQFVGGERERREERGDGATHRARAPRSRGLCFSPWPTRPSLTQVGSILKRDADAVGARPLPFGTSLVQTVDGKVVGAPAAAPARAAGGAAAPAAQGRPSKPPPKAPPPRPPQRDGPPKPPGKPAAVAPPAEPPTPPETPRTLPPPQQRPGWIPKRSPHSDQTLEDAIDASAWARDLAPAAPPTTAGQEATVENGRTVVKSVPSGGAGQFPSDGAGQMPSGGAGQMPMIAPSGGAGQGPNMFASVSAPAAAHDAEEATPVGGSDDDDDGVDPGAVLEGEGKGTTSTGDARAAATQASSPSTRTKTAAIAGGVVGGLLLLTAVALGVRSCVVPRRPRSASGEGGATAAVAAVSRAECGGVASPKTPRATGTPISAHATGSPTVSVAAAAAMTAAKAAAAAGARARASVGEDGRTDVSALHNGAVLPASLSPKRSTASEAAPGSPLGGLRSRYGGPAAPPPPPRLFGAPRLTSEGTESAPPSPAVARVYSGAGTPLAGADADCACASSFFARRAAHRAGGASGPLSFHEDACPLKPGF